jgi:hypothetical protein
MTLSAQQLVDTRRYMGYSVTGDAFYANFRELVYSDVSYMGIALDDPTGVGGRLAHLSPEEETTLTTYYLPTLTAREADIQAASANLDTDKAAIWTHNKSEVSERRSMFMELRVELCHWLGFSPGPGIQASNRLVRA